jgi:phosphate transport system substrate-binding protein
LILWTAEGSRAEEILHGAGATFPLPLYRQWFELFARETGIRTSYQAVGSGEGIQRLLSRWVDFAATDAFLTSEEMGQAQAAVLHIPTCVGAVTMSYNLTEIDELRLTPELLSEILLGHITHWFSPRWIWTVTPWESGRTTRLTRSCAEPRPSSASSAASSS